MDHAVRDRRGHGVDCSTVFSAVASSDDVPAVADLVLADPSAQQELLCESLHGGRCVGELIQEEDPSTLSTQPLGTGVAGHSLVDVGEATQIGGRNLTETQVDDL